MYSFVLALPSSSSDWKMGTDQNEVVTTGGLTVKVISGSIVDVQVRGSGIGRFHNFHKGCIPFNFEMVYFAITGVVLKTTRQIKLI